MWKSGEKIIYLIIYNFSFVLVFWYIRHMTELLTPEQEKESFNPKIGELMVRNIYNFRPDDGESLDSGKWILHQKSLHFFNEVGEKGKPWSSQQIANFSFFDKDESINPDFESYSDCATSSNIYELGNTRVERFKATDLDLYRFVGGVLKYFNDKAKRLNDFDHDDFLKSFSNEDEVKIKDFKVNKFFLDEKRKLEKTEKSEKITGFGLLQEWSDGVVDFDNLLSKEKSRMLSVCSKVMKNDIRN